MPLPPALRNQSPGGLSRSPAAFLASGPSRGEILVVTHYTYELLPYAALFERHARLYCALHGYDFLAFKHVDAPKAGGHAGALYRRDRRGTSADSETAERRGQTARAQLQCQTGCSASPALFTGRSKRSAAGSSAAEVLRQHARDRQGTGPGVPRVRRGTPQGQSPGEECLSSEV